MKQQDADNDSETLKQLLVWTKLNVILNHKQMVINLMQSPKQKLVFQSSDGKTSRELAQQFRMDKNTVTKWWKLWIDKGIATPITVQGGGIKAQRNFSLEEFGIEIPTLEEAMSQTSEEE